jgi:hypothetical protein
MQSANRKSSQQTQMLDLVSLSQTVESISLTSTEMDNPNSLKQFFGIMLSVLRIINSIVLKYQSDQTLKLARSFLKENRASVVGVFKRYAGVGGLDAAQNIDLGDLVDNLTVLISATKYLEVSNIFDAVYYPTNAGQFEEQAGLSKPGLSVFS